MNYDFEKGEIILVDKPYGWTSFDVVNYIKHRVKRITGNKKLKVGHAGTLDPLATGLVMVCTGKKTKEIDSLQAQTKEYKGSMLLGYTSPSYDLESKPGASHRLWPDDPKIISQACANFLGEIEQIPPQFSAKKINGKRAYESARKGINIEMKSSKVTIFHFELTRIDGPYIDFILRCSKGTYVRSLVYDFGQVLGCGAIMTALRRSKSGDFNVSNALSIRELKNILDKAPL